MQHEEVYVVFISESWERESKTLNKMIKLQDNEIISNVLSTRKSITFRTLLTL